jgi:hypothetical protein
MCPSRRDNLQMFIDADETCHQRGPKGSNHTPLFTIFAYNNIFLFFFHSGLEKIYVDIRTTSDFLAKENAG